MNGYQKYKEKSIYSMSSSEPLPLLYDEAIGRLSKAEYVSGDKEYGIFEDCLLRITRIARYLTDILNMSLPISGDLYRIYNYLICNISRTKAGQERQKGEIGRIKHILSELREAFKEASRKAADVHMVQNKGLIGQEENVGPSTEQIMLPLQRQYNVLREISRLTEELQEAVSCSDRISVPFLVEMRADETAKAESCQNDIWLMAENKLEYVPVIRELIRSDPFAAHPPGCLEEQKIFELWRKTSALIKDIQEKDRNMSLRVYGDRSYYAKTSNKRQEGGREMVISEINGYNLYGYQNAMNMLKLSFVQNTQRQAVSPVKRPSSVNSSSSVYGDIQSFLRNYWSELTGLEVTASRLTGASSRNAFNNYKAASTDEQVAVAKGSYRLRDNIDTSLNVGALAQVQKNISSSHYPQETVDEGVDMDLKITSGSGEALVSISSMNENGTAKTYNQVHQEAAKATNAQSSLRVKASASNVEDKVSLILTSKSTGEVNGFPVTGNVGAAVGLEDASVQAQDAEYTVTENGYSQTYHSGFNTISLDYGRIDAALKGTGDIRVYTGGDEDEVVLAVEDLVKSYNSVTKLLEKNAGRGTSAAAHSSSFKWGVADEKTLKALGIIYDKDGYLQSDKDALKEALESDFEGTQSLIDGQFGIVDRAAARVGSVLLDPVQRIVNQDLASAIAQNQNDNYAGCTQFGNFARSGAYSLSNYYTAGLFFSMMA